VPERVGDLPARGVEPAVADEHPLAVAHEALLTGEVEVRRGVFQAQRDRLGQPTAGVGSAGEDIGDRPAHRLAAQPALQHGGRVLFPGRGAHGRAVGEHDHYRCARSAEPGQQVGLGRGEVDVGAVEALGLGDGGQAEVGHDDVGARRDPHGLLGQRRVLGRVVDPEPRGVVDLRVGQRGDQLVERGVDPGGVDLRAPRALVARRGGERADDGDAARVRQRESPVVAQQDHAGCRRPTGEGVVGGVGHVGGRAAAGLPDEPQHPGGRGVEDLLGQRAVGDRVDDRLVADPEVRRHLQIQACGEGRDPVGDRAPVGHHQPVEPHSSRRTSLSSHRCWEA
jgi:hypothetical protein